MPKKSQQQKTSALDSEQAILSTNYTQSRTKFNNISQSQLTNGFTFRNTTLEHSSSRSPSQRMVADKSKSSLTKYLIPKNKFTSERKKPENDNASFEFETAKQDIQRKIKQKFIKKQGQTYNVYSQFDSTVNLRQQKSRNLSLNIDSPSNLQAKLDNMPTSLNSPMMTHMTSDRIIGDLSDQSIYETLDLTNKKKKKRAAKARGLRSETVSEMFKQQEQTPGFYNVIGLGPSMLLKQSGSKSSIPKMGDYHTNIKKNSKYVNAGPGHYHLPSLFDNYQPNKDLNINTQHSHNKVTANHQLLRNAPQQTFSVKSPVARIISRQHDNEQMGLISPGVGTYSPGKGTFEILKQKGGYEFGMGKTVAHDAFAKQMRFHQPKKSWVETVPVGYLQIESDIGKLQQAKFSPKISSTTLKQYELSKNRTFFGIPAKCEGPGPHLNPDVEKAFRSISCTEQTLNQKQSQSKITSFQDRFDISGKLAYKEFSKGLQAYTSGKEVPGSKYEFEVSDIVGPKRIKSIVQGTQQRQSNYLPEQNDDKPNAVTYDVQTKYGYVNIKNAKNEMHRLQKELSQSPKNADIQQQILDLPQVKTSYRITGGQFPIDERKCGEF